MESAQKEQEKKPAWCKLWLHHRPMLEAVPDAALGRAIKAALAYFATGQLVPLEPVESLVFVTLQADIDQACADFARDIANGKKGGRPRKPPVRGGNPPQPSPTHKEGEGEGEGEREGDREGEYKKAGKPPNPQVFQPPTVEDVIRYCRERNCMIEAERFVDHYKSNGWMVGKNKMKDWKAAVRNWSRKEIPNAGKTGSEPVWPTIGTTV